MFYPLGIDGLLLTTFYYRTVYLTDVDTYTPQRPLEQGSLVSVTVSDSKLCTVGL